MAKRFNFDEAITTDIKGAASDSYIDNIKMIKVTDIETNSENFYSLPDIEELAEDIERQGLIHSLAVTKTSYGTYKLISGHRRLSAIKLLSEKGNMIVTKIQLELLKLNEIELAAFPKDDGKYNVAFMPDTKELITKILYPADESKQETEYERNNRLNKEIKRLAAVNGEKPKYRMVAPELLDNIKRSGIQFAYFKKGDKYNIVFLRKNETEIDQLLKQLRKEK